MRKNAITATVGLLCLFGGMVCSAPQTMGTAHITLKGDVQLSFDMRVKSCMVLSVPNTLISGLTVQMIDKDVITGGILGVTNFSGDKTYVRSSTADKTMLLSITPLPIRRDNRSLAVDVREGEPGKITATITNQGLSGEMIFEGVAVTHFSDKVGTISGSVNWTCTSLSKI